MKKLLLIGCGHMGHSLLTTWINSKNYSLTIIDPNKYSLLKKKLKDKKIKIFKSLSELTKFTQFDYIILATRPKELDSVLSDLSNINLNSETTIISIIAGKKIKVLKNTFKNINNFFRVMPNMPALIGKSMNCIVSNKEASKIKKHEVLKLFSYSGKTIFLDTENQIDKSTAISGSGPGFIFNIIDAMEKAAIKLGFKKEIAKILVLETFKGSVDLILKNKNNAQDLVHTVATKGGTTEAGLKIMNKNNFHKIFVEVAKASYNRAKKQGELSAKK